MILLLVSGLLPLKWNDSSINSCYHSSTMTSRRLTVAYRCVRRRNGIYYVYRAADVIHLPRRHSKRPVPVNVDILYHQSLILLTCCLHIVLHLYVLRLKIIYEIYIVISSPLICNFLYVVLQKQFLQWWSILPSTLPYFLVVLAIRFERRYVTGWVTYVLYSNHCPRLSCYCYVTTRDGEVCIVIVACPPPCPPPGLPLL